MRLVLEKDEILTLIGKALGYNLSESDVKISTDPFELELKNVRPADIGSTPPKTTSLRVQESSPTPEFPTVLDDDGQDLSDVLAQSERLADELPSRKIDPDSKGINDFSRPLAANESEDPPGEDYESEIRR